MKEIPEEKVAARVERNRDAETFVIVTRGAGIEPTLPRFHEHLRLKKAEASVHPAEIIDGEGDEGDEIEERAVRRSKKKHR